MVTLQTNEKHELTLAFDTSEELWEFAKEHQDKVVAMTDYKIDRWENKNGNDDNR